MLTSTNKKNSVTLFEKAVPYLTSLNLLAAVLVFCSFSYVYLDQKIALYMKYSMWNDMVNAAYSITELGNPIVYIAILPVLFLFTRFIVQSKKHANIVLFILLSVTIPGLICDILKILCGRYRPTLLFNDHMYGFSFFKLHADMWSFPSGHSVTITGLMFALSLVFPRFWLLFCSIIVMVCFSRVVVCAHYLSDVVFGMYLSMMIVLFLYRKCINNATALNLSVK